MKFNVKLDGLGEGGTVDPGAGGEGGAVPGAEGAGVVGVDAGTMPEPVVAASVGVGDDEVSAGGALGGLLRPLPIVKPVVGAVVVGHDDDAVFDELFGEGVDGLGEVDEGALGEVDEGVFDAVDGGESVDYFDEYFSEEAEDGEGFDVEVVGLARVGVVGERLSLDEQWDALAEDDEVWDGSEPVGDTVDGVSTSVVGGTLASVSGHGLEVGGVGGGIVDGGLEVGVEVGPASAGVGGEVLPVNASPVEGGGSSVTGVGVVEGLGGVSSGECGTFVAPGESAGGVGGRPEVVGVGGRGVQPVVVPVPDAPALGGRDAAVLAAREAGVVAAREALSVRPVVLDGGVLEGQVGLSYDLAYEVRVDDSGRESAEAKRLKVREVVVGGGVGGKPELASVRVVDGSGREKWSGRGSGGRLGPRQLAAFSNLNRSKVDPHADDVVRGLFARGDDPELTPAQAKRLKKLANRAVFGGDQVRSGSRARFTLKDREVLRFIGMFKYATAKHVARVHQVKEETMLKRLYVLQDRGLVLKMDLYGTRPLWFLTEGGLICSGLEVPRVKEAAVSYSMMPHQFVVNHTAGSLWGGGVNVLALEDFPGKFKALEDGSLGLGESLVSEYEIQSSFANAKRSKLRADEYRPLIQAAMDRDFKRWVGEGGVLAGVSPEMVLGNEYMWTLFPPFSLKLAHHVPDLVVKRPRNEDGTPNSIAVEVELANKAAYTYERTLNAYKYDTMIYGKVVWVVKSRGAARKIKEAAQAIGLWESGRVGIVPIRTEDGLFKGKEWLL